MLQTIRFGLDQLVHMLDPPRVQMCLGLLWRDHGQCPDGLFVAVDILARFSLLHGEFEGLCI